MKKKKRKIIYEILVLFNVNKFQLIDDVFGLIM